MNDRFPHKVIISRIERDTLTGEYPTDIDGIPTSTIIFESQCGLRSASDVDINDKVLEYDLKLALPKHNVQIKHKDKVTFINNLVGTQTNGEVIKSEVYNLGSNLWIKTNGNTTKS